MKQSWLIHFSFNHFSFSCDRSCWDTNILDKVEVITKKMLFFSFMLFFFFLFGTRFYPFSLIFFSSFFVVIYLLLSFFPYYCWVSSLFSSFKGVSISRFPFVFSFLRIKYHGSTIGGNREMDQWYMTSPVSNITRKTKFSHISWHVFLDLKSVKTENK